MTSETLPEGRHDLVWGVDLSTLAISIGWVRVGDRLRGVITVEFDKSLRHGHRLSDVYEKTKAAAKRLSIDRPPVFVGVEQPSGTYAKPQLSYVAGVIQAAIWSAIYEHWHKPVETQTITSHEWKSGVVKADGFSKVHNFGKPKSKKDYNDYPALQWARSVGYSGDDLNEADAYCVAEALCRMLHFGYG